MRLLASHNLCSAKSLSRLSKRCILVPRAVLSRQGVCVLQALTPNSPVGSLPKGAKQVLHVNGFDVEYRPDGSVQQFKSDLSVFDLDGNPKQQKIISVNQPIRCAVCISLVLCI